MPHQDYSPDLSLDVRGVQVDHLADSTRTAQGIHTTVQTNASTRSTELHATKTPFIPKLLPLEDTMLRLELKYRQPVTRGGITVKAGLCGMALYIAIAAEMAGNKQRPGRYPDMTFMRVRDILNSAFIKVARQYYMAAENEFASLKLE